MGTNMPGASPYGAGWSPPPREPYIWTDPADGEVRSFPVPPTWGVGARAGTARITNNTRGTLFLLLGADRTPDEATAEVVVAPYSTSTITLESGGVSALWRGTAGTAAGRPQVVSVELVATPGAPTSSAITPPVAPARIEVFERTLRQAQTTGSTFVFTQGGTIMGARVENPSPWLLYVGGSDGGLNIGHIGIVPPWSSRSFPVGWPRLIVNAAGPWSGTQGLFLDEEYRVTLSDLPMEDTGPDPSWLPLVDGRYSMADERFTGTGTGNGGTTLLTSPGFMPIIVREAEIASQVGSTAGTTTGIIELRTNVPANPSLNRTILRTAMNALPSTVQLVRVSRLENPIVLDYGNLTFSLMVNWAVAGSPSVWACDYHVSAGFIPTPFS